MNKKITTSLVASFLLATTQLQANDEYQLSTITVSSATKTEQSIKDVTSNINVITKEEIEEKKFTTVSEALNTISGINVVSNGGLGKSQSVFMRGFDSQRILVLIDGIRYNDVTGISGARFEHLMITDIERIEVVKGAQSGIWGADATAGIINIITTKSKMGFSANANVELGSFNTRKLQMGVSQREEKYDIKLAVSRILSDGLTSRAVRGKNIDDYEDDKYANTTINLKTGFNFDDNNRIELNHNIIETSSEYDNSMLQQEGYELKSTSEFSSLNFTNNNKYSDIYLYTNYTKFDRDDEKGWTKEFDGTMKEQGLNIKIPYLSESFILTGVDYKVSEHQNDLNKSSKNKGVFITNSTKLGTTIVTQSLRYDEYDTFDNKTTGKIGIKHNILNDLYVSSNYGTAYNVPTMYKLYDTGAGYADLQPETTKSADFTIGYKNLTLTYFHNKITDMIDYNTGTWKYDNIEGETKLKGIEIAYSQEVIDDLLLNLNYTYTNAKDDNKKDLQRRAEKSLKFSLDYYGFSKWHLNFNGEYVGNRVEYNYGTYDISAQTGNYTVWNGVINYEISKNLNAYVKLDNITDKYYQTIDGYATAPRSAYIGLKASF